ATRIVSWFMGIGLFPDSGFKYTLPRLIGHAKALEIAVFDKPITGEKGQEIGLATKLLEKDEWEEQVHSFAESMATLPTKAFSLMKRYMMDGMHTHYRRSEEEHV